MFKQGWTLTTTNDNNCYSCLLTTDNNHQFVWLSVLPYFQSTGSLSQKGGLNSSVPRVQLFYSCNALHKWSWNPQTPYTQAIVQHCQFASLLLEEYKSKQCKWQIQFMRWILILRTFQDQCHLLRQPQWDRFTFSAIANHSSERTRPRLDWSSMLYTAIQITDLTPPNKLT